MIDRYTRPVMKHLWSEQVRFEFMLEMEKKVALCQGQMKLIPMTSAQVINKKAKFYLADVQKEEIRTRHDVAAFVRQVAHHVGKKHGSYVHWGLTSSDVLDTARSLQIQAACKELNKSFKSLEKALIYQIRTHKKTLCVGRTHGIHAEPLTFGYRLCGFLEELRRAWRRVEQAAEENRYGKVSGAVGAYNNLPEALEKKVCAALKLRQEPLSTQVLPRDRQASLIFALSLVGCHLERLAIDLRHLQRTEVSEVCESFAKEQMGSSAMPHKKNPISAENITGLARLLRSYVSSASENIALWHERDISHSSVERVIFPDAFILVDYALNRMAVLIDNLYVDIKQMKKNLMLTQGQILSSQLLSALVTKNWSRDKAYKWIQKCSHNKNSEDLLKSFRTDKELVKLFSASELKKITSFEVSTKMMEKKIERCLKRTKSQRWI